MGWPGGSCLFSSAAPSQPGPCPALSPPPRLSGRDPPAEAPVQPVPQHQALYRESGRAPRGGRGQGLARSPGHRKNGLSVPAPRGRREWSPRRWRVHAYTWGQEGPSALWLGPGLCSGSWASGTGRGTEETLPVPPHCWRRTRRWGCRGLRDSVGGPTGRPPASPPRTPGTPRAGRPRPPRRPRLRSHPRPGPGAGRAHTKRENQPSGEPAH